MYEMKTSTRTIARLTVRSSDTHVLIAPRVEPKTLQISPFFQSMFPGWKSRFIEIEAYHN